MKAQTKPQENEERQSGVERGEREEENELDGFQQKENPKKEKER